MLSSRLRWHSAVTKLWCSEFRSFRDGYSQTNHFIHSTIKQQRVNVRSVDWSRKRMRLWHSGKSFTSTNPTRSMWTELKAWNACTFRADHARQDTHGAAFDSHFDVCLTYLRFVYGARALQDWTGWLRTQRNYLIWRRKWVEKFQPESIWASGTPSNSNKNDINCASSIAFDREISVSFSFQLQNQRQNKQSAGETRCADGVAQHGALHQSEGASGDGLQAEAKFQKETHRQRG